MKKLFCMALILCVCMAGAPVADAATLQREEDTDVPSVMTQDSVREFTMEAGGQAVLLQPYEETVDLLEQMYDFVWRQKGRPVRFYDGQTQSRIAALAPEIDIDSLYMTEFMGTQIENGAADGKTVTMHMEIDTKYTPGRLVVVVMGMKADDGSYRWFPYRGEVPQTGVIEWQMGAQDAEALSQEKTVLQVLTVRTGAGGYVQGQTQEDEGEPRPSRQARDLTKIDDWSSESGEPIDDLFRIYYVERTQEMDEEMLRMEQFIGEGNAPIEWFPEDVRRQVQQMQPGGAEIGEMVIYDIEAVMDENYREAYGDIATESSFPTSYSAQKEMFALLGIQTQEGGFEWHYLRANGLDETQKAEIVYKQRILPVLQQEPAMLVVFSEPLIEDDAEE